jgi:hypothetical protein
MESEACVDSTLRTIVSLTPTSINDDRDMGVFEEFELNGEDQMTELHPTWVPTRSQQRTVEERDDWYDLRSRVHHDTRMGRSRPENEVTENAVLEILNEHENRRLSSYNLRPLPGRRKSEREST